MSDIIKKVDFHTHILQCVDDGSCSADESIGMLSALADSDVDAVVLTPHFYADGDTPDRFLTRRGSAYKQLKEAVEASDKKLPQTVLGAEIEYFEGIMSLLDYPDLRIGNSGCILLEMPHGVWTSRMIDDVLCLNEHRGFRVIIAHVERYLFEQKKSTVNMLLENGVLMQSNASYFTERRTTAKAIRNVKRGLIHLIGSDCHNLTTRPPNIGDACAVISKRAGDDILSEMMQGAHHLLRHDIM